ncbi:hypothetical protein Lepto7376_3321 [[Leptolyngbya] sp. PCC 7376]|nr:hypothetical protein Lepto7376_3321 [[Leptolyngbya] sp. PCC 7376]
MSVDLLKFALFAIALGLYLLWSAKTEMGTKLFQRPEDKE